MPVMRLAVLLFIIFLLAACSGNQSESLPTESAAVEESPTGLPAQSTDIVEDTPLERGRAVFTSFLPQAGFSCATCHYTASERRLIGPGLLDIQERIATYNLDMDAETYLRTSVLAPDSFITPANPAYPAGVMPQNYSVVLTPEQLEDLLVYLLSL